MAAPLRAMAHAILADDPANLDAVLDMVAAFYRDQIEALTARAEEILASALAPLEG